MASLHKQKQQPQGRVVPPCIPFLARHLFVLLCDYFSQFSRFRFGGLFCCRVSITGMVVFSKRWIDHRRSIRQGFRCQSAANRVGLRPPRLAVDLAYMMREREFTSGVLEAFGNLCCNGCNEVGVMTMKFSMESVVFG
ncbi:hypothetical protein NC653_026614 [Populus alba x Populus x berolinensis]|uniref:Uncharacterized protein n=1 Tax=Populus alba x Populus x berolinensis TaxID=444605 RepID=A0AAD6ME76_9ROSI|nr:hypothetical protein NC653_026614 [Populus alba x Populus x berolinensis]